MIESGALHSLPADDYLPHAWRLSAAGTRAVLAALARRRLITPLYADHDPRRQWVPLPAHPIDLDRLGICFPYKDPAHRIVLVALNDATHDQCGYDELTVAGLRSRYGCTLAAAARALSYLGALAALPHCAVEPYPRCPVVTTEAVETEMVRRILGGWYLESTIVGHRRRPLPTPRELVLQLRSSYPAVRGAVENLVTKGFLTATDQRPWIALPDITARRPRRVARTHRTTQT